MTDRMGENDMGRKKQISDLVTGNHIENFLDLLYHWVHQSIFLGDTIQQLFS